MTVIRLRLNIYAKLTFTTLWAYSADGNLIILFYFSQKIVFDISCKLYPKKTTCTKCQVCLQGKIKKYSKYCLLKSLPRVLIVKIGNRCLTLCLWWIQMRRLMKLAIDSLSSEDDVRVVFMTNELKTKGKYTLRSSNHSWDSHMIWSNKSMRNDQLKSSSSLKQLACQKIRLRHFKLDLTVLFQKIDLGI